MQFVSISVIANGLLKQTSWPLRRVSKFPLENTNQYRHVSIPSSTATSIALVGNPNAGKTALFNSLTGLRARTANYPGITVDVRKGRLKLGANSISLLDLPGLYSLDSQTAEEKVTAELLNGQFRDEAAPDLIVLVLDATNVERNLFLASEVLDLNRPTIVALNLIDAANESGIKIDHSRLAERLGCEVVPVSSWTGNGLAELTGAIEKRFQDPLLVLPAEHDRESCIAGCTGCTFSARYDWAARTADGVVETPAELGESVERIDRVLTHPVIGILAFLSLMLGVFYLIFSLAGVPMDLIEGLFGWLGASVDRLIPADAKQGLGWFVSVFAGTFGAVTVAGWAARYRWSWLTGGLAVLVSLVAALLPVEDFRSLLIDGVIGGVGGVVVFLPQICILFFCIALLEDSGYLARASFVMERLMRYVGLPGKAFVPMLSAHACAIPGIMATRVIEDWRDRLVTILVLPLLTCSARLPVYGMLAILLFSESKLMASLVFLGAYLLGIVAALGAAFCLKRTILQGETSPLVLELPPYRRPSLRNAVLTVWDRASVFVRQAGTVILALSIILWIMVTYPKLDESDLPTDVAEQVSALRLQAESDDEVESDMAAQADQLVSQAALANSFAGRLGRAFEPVFRPLGFDWKINVGVLSSFAAREVIVSTLSIIYGIGEDGAEDEASLTETLRAQKYPDGTPVYSRPTCYSLLVFYVLAMQCLPTQAVTKRETGSWNWAIFQLVYMTVLAYVAALATFQFASFMVQ